MRIRSQPRPRMPALVLAQAFLPARLNGKQKVGAQRRPSLRCPRNG